MRIRKRVELEGEVDIQINVEDVADAIHEAAAELQRDPERRNAVTNLLNTCAMVLKAITDQQIREMFPAPRSITRDFLEQQAKRYEEEF
jgi:uncharacterized membrane protein